MLELFLFPYLVLSQRIEVGSWELIPFAEFQDSDVRSGDAARQARQLFELYRSPSDEQIGAVVRRRRRKVGDSVRRGAMPTLRRAMMVAVLDANSAPPDSGHGTSTSDNVVFYGHPIGPDGRVTAVYGEILQTWMGGLRLGEETSEIRPPIELARPMLGRDPDQRYADAFHGVLETDDPAARRLAAAIDWLDLAWRNSPSVTTSIRVLALYSGFEVLLDVGNGRRPMARALSRLLDRQRTRRREHEWRPRPDSAPKTEALTDVEWWFMQFGDLRNRIAHGDELPRRCWKHGRQWHFWIAERRLREAMTEIVSQRTGIDELRRERGERALVWAFRDALESTANRRDYRGR